MVGSVACLLFALSAFSMMLALFADKKNDDF
jgi:hypothetical protein